MTAIGIATHYRRPFYQTTLGIIWLGLFQHGSPFPYNMTDKNGQESMIIDLRKQLGPKTYDRRDLLRSAAFLQVYLNIR